jgi:hypothetical protein
MRTFILWDIIPVLDGLGVSYMVIKRPFLSVVRQSRLLES